MHLFVMDVIISNNYSYCKIFYKCQSFATHVLINGDIRCGLMQCLLLNVNKPYRVVDICLPHKGPSGKPLPLKIATQMMSLSYI